MAPRTPPEFVHALIATYGIELVSKVSGQSTDLVNKAADGEWSAVSVLWNRYAELNRELRLIAAHTTNRSGRPREALSKDKRHALIDVELAFWQLARAIGISELSLMNALAGKEVITPTIYAIESWLRAGR